jgi:putative hydrolase of the HAD superfamily
MNCRAVLFDLYDTLLYARPTGMREKALELISRAGIAEAAWLRSWRATLNPSLRGEIPSQRRRIKLALEGAGGDAPAPELIDEVTGLMLTRMAPCLHEDTPRALKELRTRGFRLGMLSNLEPFQRPWIKELELEPRFDEIVLSCEVGLLKPEPEIYLLAAKKLAVTPEECVFVGDGMFNELGGARAAGLTPVRIDRAIRAEIEEPDEDFDFRVSNLAELLAWLPGQAGGTLGT